MLDRANNDFDLTAMIFIDLKKAFDTVGHSILLDKMKFCGISGIEHDLFRLYLNNRKQFCKVNVVSSDIKDTDIGVPQRSCFVTYSFSALCK